MGIGKAQTRYGTSHQRSYLQNNPLLDAWLCPFIEKTGPINHRDSFALCKFDHLHSIFYSVLPVRIKRDDVTGAMPAGDEIKTCLKRSSLTKIQGVT